MRRIAIASCLLAACATTHATPPAAPPPAPSNTAPPSAPPPAATGADADADALIAKILAPDPPQETFRALLDLLPNLSPAKRDAIHALGTDNAHPVHVPDIGFEYDWVDAFDCDGAHASDVQQSLVNGPAGELDLLEFACPGSATRHGVYFDFSADPQEKAMRKELGAPPP